MSKEYTSWKNWQLYPIAFAFIFSLFVSISSLVSGGKLAGTIIWALLAIVTGYGLSVVSRDRNTKTLAISVLSILIDLLAVSIIAAT